jgi:hypothetical protein
MEYFDIREEIGILGNIQKFMVYVKDMLEIYPQFRGMTLDDIDDFLDKRETEYEQDIQKKLNVK